MAKTEILVTKIHSAAGFCLSADDRDFQHMRMRMRFGHRKPAEMLHLYDRNIVWMPFPIGGYFDLTR